MRTQMSSGGVSHTLIWIETGTHHNVILTSIHVTNWKQRSDGLMDSVLGGGLWFHSQFCQKPCLSQHPYRSWLLIVNKGGSQIELPSLWVLAKSLPMTYPWAMLNQILGRPISALLLWQFVHHWGQKHLGTSAVKAWTLRSPEIGWLHAMEICLRLIPLTFLEKLYLLGLVLG